MPIPEKAIAYEKIQHLIKEEARLGDGSHVIYHIEFDDCGESLKGFFKKLDEKYPVFLAKLAVAASCLQRNVLGAKAAEERLVMQGAEIVGTFSVEIQGFTPFKYRAESFLESEKSLVIPTTAQLLQDNVIELLFAAKFFANDDLHPHNLSLQGIIDMDMCYRFLVLRIKPRIISELNFFKTTPQNVSLQDFGFTTQTLHNFPWDSGPHAAWHWPTFLYPGEGSLPKTSLTDLFFKSVFPKAYAAPEQFIRLVSEPLAHRQKLVVALKFLLSYQPTVLEARLKHYLGDLPLNYKKLEEGVVSDYETKFPELFSVDSNDESFVQFMLKLYAAQHINLYQALIFDSGGVNIKGFVLESINKIFQESSYLDEILAWMQEENSKSYRDFPVLQLDLEEAKKNYYLLWRDTFILSIQKLQEHLHEKVIGEIYKVFTDTDLFFVQVADKKKFLEVPCFEIAEEKTCLETYYCVKVGPELINFALDLKKVFDGYYMPGSQEDFLKDNIKFLEELFALLKKGQRIIEEIPADKPSFHAFKDVLCQLQELQKKMNFEVHLSNPATALLDEAVKMDKGGFDLLEESQELEELEEHLSLTDAAEKAEGFDLLLEEPQLLLQDVLFFFEEMNKKEASDFDEALIRIVHENYRKLFSAYNPSLLKSYPAKPDICALLEKNQCVKNHQKLALVLQLGEVFAEMSRAVIEQLFECHVPKTKTNFFLIEAIVNFVSSKEYDDYNQQYKEDTLVQKEWVVLT